MNISEKNKQEVMKIISSTTIAKKSKDILDDYMNDENTKFKKLGSGYHLYNSKNENKNVIDVLSYHIDESIREEFIDLHDLWKNNFKVKKSRMLLETFFMYSLLTLPYENPQKNDFSTISRKNGLFLFIDKNSLFVLNSISEDKKIFFNLSIKKHPKFSQLYLKLHKDKINLIAKNPNRFSKLSKIILNNDINHVFELLRIPIYLENDLQKVLESIKSKKVRKIDISIDGKDISFHLNSQNELLDFTTQEKVGTIKSELQDLSGETEIEWVPNSAQ